MFGIYCLFCVVTERAQLSVGGGPLFACVRLVLNSTQINIILCYANKRDRLRDKGNISLGLILDGKMYKNIYLINTS